MSNPKTEQLRTMIRGAYDQQKLRIMMGNRIVANFKAKMGQAPGDPEDVLDKESLEILEIMRLSYDRITDGVVTFPRFSTFKGDEVISTFTELCLIEQYISIENTEQTAFKRLNSILNEYPIYTEFLKDVRGIGPAMAGVIVSEIDPHKSKYVTSIWKYAGLDVASDGKGRSKKTEHLVDVEYKDKEGEVRTKKSITYNPFLKTKLVGVLATSFLRSGKESYAKYYYAYKTRLQHMPIHEDKTDNHRHKMAMRYMIKIFLIDLYKQWRRLEGLPVYDDYATDKLGFKHGLDV